MVHIQKTSKKPFSVNDYVSKLKETTSAVSWMDQHALLLRRRLQLGREALICPTARRDKFRPALVEAPLEHAAEGEIKITQHV